MLLLHQTRSQRLDAVGKLDAYHEALATHVNDGRGFGGQSFQLSKEVTADAGGVFNEVFFLDDIKHSQGCRAGQMVATEGGAELTEDGFKLGGDEHRAHRKTVADAFGAGDDVGTDTCVLMGEEFAATPIATLYLVADEHCSVLAAGFAKPLHELGCGKTDATHALNTFNNDCRHIALGKFALEGFEVIERKELHMAVGIDGSNDFWIIGGFNRQGGAAVEGF